MDRLTISRLFTYEDFFAKVTAVPQLVMKLRG